MKKYKMFHVKHYRQILFVQIICNVATAALSAAAILQGFRILTEALNEKLDENDNNGDDTPQIQNVGGEKWQGLTAHARQLKNGLMNTLTSDWEEMEAMAEERSRQTQIGI